MRVARRIFEAGEEDGHVSERIAEQLRAGMDAPQPMYFAGVP